MLQEEEQRALRQIAATKQKAANIRQTMADNEARMRQQLQQQDARKEEEQKMRDYVQSLRDEHNSTRGKKYEEIQALKLTNAQCIKQKKESDALAIRDARWNFQRAVDLRQKESCE